MPAFYAHKKFGEEVWKLLPQELQEQVAAYQEVFDIGLHGPDILYFYHPLRRTSVGKLGLKIHHATGSDFFEYALKKIEKSEHQEVMLVYAMGVVCHLALDAACHPYIHSYQKQSTASHHEIEKELEKYLMRKDGICPFQYDFKHALNPRMAWAQAIAPFYDLSPVQIQQAIEGFLFYNQLFFTTSLWKRTLVFAGMKMSGYYEKDRGLFADRTDKERCRNSNHRLEQLFWENRQVAAAMIEEFDEKQQEGGAFSAWFHRSFS